MSSIQTFEDLHCWQNCRKLKLKINQIIKKFPKQDFDLKWNLKRASRSTTRNIAEGYGRHHTRENLQFCRISRGSLFEIKDDLITCIDEGYIVKEEYNALLNVYNDALKSLNGYIRYLKRS